MQIQTFTEKIETSDIVAFLSGRLQILKILTLYFYSCPALENSLSVARKVDDF